jgi:NAD(P)-dependent dehydrogenase (short-subunit alcohol dehydrogenase family)
MFEVKDLVIIVTGSSGGNGSAISKKLQELGANIIDCDLPKYDVTKDEDLNRVVQNALKINGQINGLVNCAGVTYGNNVLDYKDELKSSIRTIQKSCKTYEKYWRFNY